ATTSAILDVSSTSAGILIPRLLTSEKNAIASPANGLMVYDTETDSFWYYDGGNSGWIEIITTATSSIDNLTDGRSDGNSIFLGEGAGASDDFTSNNNIGIGKNSLYSITTGSTNIAIGKYSSYNATTAYGSIAIGEYAFLLNTEKSGIAIGVEALRNNGTDATLPHHSNSNIAIGFQSLRTNTTGYSNISTGSQSLTLNTTGFKNTAIGASSLYSNKIGHENTAIGYHTLNLNTQSNNIAIGSSSMEKNTTGYSNVSVGVLSLGKSQNGDYNVAMGNYALFNNLSGSSNISIGNFSDYNNQNGDNNTIIGNEAGKGTSTHSKSGNIFLGYQAGYNELGDNKLYIENSNSSTPLIGGDFENDSLFINAVVRITGGSPGADKILTSDEDGNSTWETPQWGATELNDLSDASTQSYSLFIGSSAGTTTVAFHNTGLGLESLQDNTTGNSNTAVGRASLKHNIDGTSNTAMGYSSLLNNTSGSSNVGLGIYSLINNLDGSNNVAIGTNSLYSNTSSSYNCAVGYEVLKDNRGEKNTAFGAHSSGHNTTGTYNVTYGYASNYYNETGSNNTIVGYQAGRSTSLHNKSGNIFLGYQAGYSETGSNKLYIENSNSSTPLIGGDFDADEVYFNTLKLGIGTSNPRELLEVASPTGSYGRMIVSDGGGDNRNVILLVSPTASNQTARIEAFNYDSGTGVTLNFNTVGNGAVVFGGNILPETHISKNLGASGQAWNNVYAHNYVTQGSAAFADVKVTQQLIDFPPMEKQSGAFDEFTEKGLKELDPISLPEALKENNAILIDEMTTYNYKANYEQQLQIKELITNGKKQESAIDELKKENIRLQELVSRLINIQNK
ncbi:MAG: hypothetical protein QM503_01830, partial [Bacteroidota bacterium]